MTSSSPARGAARRDLLLNATLQVVAEEGAAAVTHRRVAAVAGVPLAATTYWFRSKEDLITTALGVAAEQDIARLGDLADEAFRGDHQEAARAIARFLCAELVEGRTVLTASYVLMIEACHRPALREISARWEDAYTNAFSLILGKIGSSQPEADAKLLLATLNGLVLKYITADSPNAHEFEELLREQVELLLFRSAR